MYLSQFSNYSSAGCNSVSVGQQNTAGLCLQQQDFGVGVAVCWQHCPCSLELTRRAGLWSLLVLLAAGSHVCPALPGLR